MATTIPTPAELADIARAALSDALDPGATGAVDLEAGSENDVFISTSVALATRNAAHIADRAAARSPQTAKGADLDALGLDLYGQVKKGAVAATGTIYLDRTGTAATTIPAGTRLLAPGDSGAPVTYFVRTSVTVAALEVDGVAVTIECVDKGTVGNILDPAEITRIQDPLPDTTWFVAADQSLAEIGGGDDAETDEIFAARLMQGASDDSKKRGVYRAILVGTLEVEGVRYATVIEPGDGTLVVFAGDPDFLLTSDLADAIRANLVGWRCLGVPVFVRAYDPILVAVTATINMLNATTNYDTDAIKAVAQANLLTYFNGAREHPDEYFLEGIRSACQRAHAEVQTVVLAAPAADVRRVANLVYAELVELPRYLTNAANITLTVAGPLSA